MRFLTSLFELGGPVVVLLLLMSVAGLAIVLYKLVQLRRTGRRAFDALHDKLSTGFLDGDRADADRVASPLKSLFQEGRDLAATAMPQGELEAELSARGSEIVRRYGSGLRPVELIAYLAPLLGLLGTVLGMIDAFRALESQGLQANSGVLAGGIWEALLTTAVGLGVAIPFTAAHALLDNKVDRLRERLEALLARLVASRRPATPSRA